MTDIIKMYPELQFWEEFNKIIEIDLKILKYTSAIEKHDKRIENILIKIKNAEDNESDSWDDEDIEENTYYIIKLQNIVNQKTYLKYICIETVKSLFQKQENCFQIQKKLLSNKNIFKNRKVAYIIHNQSISKHTKLYDDFQKIYCT